MFFKKYQFPGPCNKLESLMGLETLHVWQSTWVTGVQGSSKHTLRNIGSCIQLAEVFKTVIRSSESCSQLLGHWGYFQPLQRWFHLLSGASMEMQSPSELHIRKSHILHSIWIQWANKTAECGKEKAHQVLGSQKLLWEETACFRWKPISCIQSQVAACVWVCGIWWRLCKNWIKISPNYTKEEAEDAHNCQAIAGCD